MKKQTNIELQQIIT